MNDNILEYRKILSGEFDQLFDATEQALDEWAAQNTEGNLQFPSLLTTLAVKFNWEEKAMRENDPIIRKYIRQHPKWAVTRGAHGGIMRRSEWEKKNAAKAAKELAKQQVQEKLEAKLAAAQAQTDSDDSE